MSKAQLRILFLTNDREDYLADGLLHGLRQLPGLEVVDYPRKECMYEGGRQCKVAPEFGVRGGGFSLYGVLTEPQGGIDRSFIWQRLAAGWFDAVLIGNVWRQWGFLLQWRELFAAQPLLLLDGDDDQRLYPRSGTRLRQFGIGTGLTNLLELPSTHMFKRELTNRSRKWGLRLNVHPLAFSIPESLISLKLPNKSQLFPSHIVDRDLSNKLGASANYVFADEQSYRSDLASSRFGITTRRAGWDCLRHYEIAAAGAVICFRDLAQKPVGCAPHGLIDGLNCISYGSSDDLLKRINALSLQEEVELQSLALAWAQSSSTKNRSLQLLKYANLLA
ncbi:MULTISPECIES: hypothetical protein [Synechococcus]|jgi:hypothetical protein|uniref:hypothetical protein n=1 Tax=Synechococcus TaxID=1129 RepID=UPI0020CB6E72|nr:MULTISPECIES: hypothetical protein [Synechococcus]MCP9925160.1 hypothetical protein [Synechococcus lacustris C3-12m-Tous]